MYSSVLHTIAISQTRITLIFGLCVLQSIVNPDSDFDFDKSDSKQYLNFYAKLNILEFWIFAAKVIN